MNNDRIPSRWGFIALEFATACSLEVYEVTESSGRKGGPMMFSIAISQVG